jgi:hypothetical protein
MTSCVAEIIICDDLLGLYLYCPVLWHYLNDGGLGCGVVFCMVEANWYKDA